MLSCRPTSGSFSVLPFLALLLPGVLSVTPPRALHAVAPTAIEPIADVVIHPLFHPHFACFEHPEGQLKRVGDALGADCSIPSLIGGPIGRWPVFYRNDGRRNEDWYGWNAQVLAPFDGIVDTVHVNPVVNRPGTLGTARASVIVFRRADGVRVLLAHVQDIRVRAGDSVVAGQMVARVGNNGPAILPHTHVGAWRGDQPLQIRFDLHAMGAMRRAD
jgi:hypothetical protein